MKLQEIFDQLSYGELSQVSIGGLDQGVISESNYSRVLAHINLGLTSLFKRFNLKEGEVFINMVKGREMYGLNSKYLKENQRSNELVKYLENVPGFSFADDVLKVEKVQTAFGTELPINIAYADYNVETPTMSSVKLPLSVVNQVEGLPDDLKGERLKITYRANHPHLAVSIGFYDPTRIEVQLPDSHLEALMYFVAGRISSPSGMTTEERLNNIWFAKYEAACQQLESENLEKDIGIYNDRLHRGGWV